MIKKTEKGWLITLNSSIYPPRYLWDTYEDFKDFFEMKMSEENKNEYKIIITPKKETNENIVYEFLNHVLANIKEEI